MVRTGRRIEPAMVGAGWFAPGDQHVISRSTPSAGHRVSVTCRDAEERMEEE
jgi:hypothetical protein